MIDEVAVYFCYCAGGAGAGAAPADAGARAAACFAAAADAMEAAEPELRAYVALLRELAAAPPLGCEAAAAAKQRALELAVRERSFL